MAASNIIIHPDVTSEEFIRYMSIWDKAKFATIEIKEANQTTMHQIFDLALPRLPHPLAEAVMDIFIENEELQIPDSIIEQCIKNGSIGLAWSVYYRKNKSDWIKMLCANRLFNVAT